MKSKFFSLTLIVLLATAYGAVALEEVAQYEGSLNVGNEEGVIIIDTGKTRDVFCGNNEIDAGEQCDGENLNGMSCSGLFGANYTGSLLCSYNCVFDAAQCALSGQATTPVSQPSNGGGGGGSGDGRSIIVSSENKSEEKAAGCIENWDCSEWGVCLDGEQVRTCTDKNNCGTIFLKPAVERLCENKFVADGKNNGFVSRILGAVIGLGSNPANLGIAAAFLVTILAAMLIVRAVKKKKAEVEAEEKEEEEE